MKGDFSRNSYDRHQHYIGVRWQQGRPTTDADENEAQDILTGRIETADLDTIGASGAPQVDPGFELSATGGGKLMIGAGRFYVDGLLVENDAAVDYEAQPDFPDAPSITAAMKGADAGLVVLEVFKRHLTYLDQPAMRDVALNGVDTTTRLQTVWRVHLLPLEVKLTGGEIKRLAELLAEVRAIDGRLAKATQPDTIARARHERKAAVRRLEDVAAKAGLACDAGYPEWAKLIAAPTGQLTVTTLPPGDDEDPCNVPEAGGYLRGENQFYRVEVHTVPASGNRNGATFKFSRDNGSIVAAVTAIGSADSGSASGATLTVDRVQRDDYLGIHVDDWVEVVDDRHELSGAPGVLARVTNADIHLNRVTLDRSVTVQFGLHPKLRKWDQVAPLATDQGVAMNTSSTPITIEGGIQLEFSAGSYRSGDYWQFAARALDASLDIPGDPQPPDGVQRHFARLGFILRATGGRVPRFLPLLDCRALFPPLTALTAADVRFDNSQCQLPDVETVQDAIEALCGQSGGGGTCTLTAVPGPNWFEVFSQIPDGGDAEICFGIGNYEIAQPVTVRGKGALRLSGAGGGTRILARPVESALTFEECSAVVVEDLFAEAGEAASEGLQGVLTFINCTEVALRRVALRCEAGVIRSAACLRIVNDREFADVRTGNGRVEVQDCDFQVASSQIGALIINGARVHVVNNVFRCVDLRKQIERIEGGLEENAVLRAEVRRTMYSDVQDGPAESAEWHTMTIREQVVHFRADPELNRIKFFDQLSQHFSQTDVRDLATAEAWLRESVDSVLLKPDTISRFDRYLKRLVDDDLPALYQGIVVGGEEADEVRIQDNTIVNALQGIHLGQSRRNQPRAERLRSTNVTIRGNTVYSRITPAINREAYGIYVGNCDGLLIEDNAAGREALRSTLHLIMDGIHVNGELGRRAIIRHNEAENYRFGVYVNPESVLKLPLWMVADNAASVRVTDARVQVINNLA